MGQILQTQFARRTVDSSADIRRGVTEAKGRIQVQTPCSNDKGRCNMQPNAGKDKKEI
jgi:hypothetical protein